MDIKYNVSGLSNPILLREFLTQTGLSKTLIKKAKPEGLFVNGERVTVRKELKNGDLVEIRLPKEKSEGIEPIDIPLNVVYEDEWLLIVDKPTNMPTHPSRGNSLPTLANAVMARYRGDFVFRAITRLDRDTSGLVLIAKDANTANFLSRELKQGKMYKRYEALVEGVPVPHYGMIDAPIRREEEGAMRRIVAMDGKSAHTEYRVKEVICENALCDVILHTGRTHQIRVHFAYIGHPLLGDFLYGERRDEGYYLRCSELRFMHPQKGEELRITI